MQHNVVALYVDWGIPWQQGQSDRIAGQGGAPPRAPAKSRFVPICAMTQVVARRHATALVQTGSQIPAKGMFGRLA
jgi:hypothetical protein